MNVDRRGFAKSLTVVGGALAAGAKVTAAFPTPAPASLARAQARLAPAMVTRIRVFYPPNYNPNGPQAFPQSNMVVLVDTDTGDPLQLLAEAARTDQERDRVQGHPQVHPHRVPLRGRARRQRRARSSLLAQDAVRGLPRFRRRLQRARACRARRRARARPRTDRRARARRSRLQRRSRHRSRRA